MMASPEIAVTPQDIPKHVLAKFSEEVVSVKHVVEVNYDRKHDGSYVMRKDEKVVGIIAHHCSCDYCDYLRNKSNF